MHSDPGDSLRAALDLLGVPRWQAAIVLLGKAWRTTSGLVEDRLVWRLKTAEGEDALRDDAIGQRYQEYLVTDSDVLVADWRRRELSDQRRGQRIVVDSWRQGLADDPGPVDRGRKLAA